MSFGRNVVKNVDKTVGKSLCGKYSLKLLDHAKKYAADAFKTTLKRSIQKKTEAAFHLIGNKIADKITGVSKFSRKNNSKRNEKEILREKLVLPELTQSY